MTGLADMDPGERALMQVVSRYQDTIKDLRAENERLREIADLTHSILNGCEWWIIETPNEGALAKAFALLGRPITAKETRRDIDRDYADFRAALQKEPPCQET